MEKTIHNVRRLLTIYGHGHRPQLSDEEVDLLRQVHGEDFRGELTDQDRDRLAELIERAGLARLLALQPQAAQQ